MAQRHSCCRLTQAEINGIGASRCVSWQPSLHEILFMAYAVHLNFVLFTCFFWKIWSYLNQIPKSVQPMKTEKNAGLIQVIWSVDIKQPFLPLFDSQALQINGATAQLLQADTGWDKWHWGQSLCVVTAEPPWNPLHCICCPSQLCALHMFLLKDLVLLEPNSKVSATYENGKKCWSHTSYLKRRH